jgi:hypothetical protein
VSSSVLYAFDERLRPGLDAAKDACILKPCSTNWNAYGRDNQSCSEYLRELRCKSFESRSIIIWSGLPLDSVSPRDAESAYVILSCSDDCTRSVLTGLEHSVRNGLPFDHAALVTLGFPSRMCGRRQLHNNRRWIGVTFPFGAKPPRSLCLHVRRAQ